MVAVAEGCEGQGWAGGWMVAGRQAAGGWLVGQAAGWWHGGGWWLADGSGWHGCMEGIHRFRFHNILYSNSKYLIVVY